MPRKCEENGKGRKNVENGDEKWELALSPCPIFAEVYFFV